MHTHSQWKRWRRLLLLPALLGVLILAACQQPDFLQAELPDDGPPIATSQAAAVRFAEKAAAAGEKAAASKRLEITITQSELTSFLTLGARLAEEMKAAQAQSLEQLAQMQGSAGASNIEGLDQLLALTQGREGVLDMVGLSDLSLRLGIREPQVYFKGDGRIIVRGYAELLGQRQPLRLVLAPRASDGELVFDFVEGTLGPVSVPEGLIDQIGLGLAKLILAGDAFVEITQIRVSDGTLTLSGGYRR